jgi:ADP-ribose pyrophosphatase YjhB (NUDIX family)
VDTPLSFFAHCPRCGVAQREDARRNAAGPFRCHACGFTLYFNAASAVAAIIVRDDGRALFIRRAKDPGKRKLGMPGGFVDAGESAEEALAREVREEVGLDVVALRYLSSHTNRYAFAGVTYTTLDLFYEGTVTNPERAAALDAVESLVWADPLTIDLDAIAFESMRAALRRYRERT